MSTCRASVRHKHRALVHLLMCMPNIVAQSRALSTASVDGLIARMPPRSARQAKQCMLQVSSRYRKSSIVPLCKRLSSRCISSEAQSCVPMTAEKQAGQALH